MAETTLCALDESRVELEKTCVSLITTFLDMKGAITNKLSDMPTKGVVVTKNTEGKSNSRPDMSSTNPCEGSSVDPPQQHQEISRLVGEQAENKELPTGVNVPSTLPQAMRERAPSLHQEDFDTFFNVQGNREILERGQLSSFELVSLYMLSFRNVLEYDLEGVGELRDRYVRYFANILADVMEMCYPQSLLMRYDERLLRDLRESKDKRQ